MHIGEVEGHALSCLPPKGILEAPTARDSGARRAGPGEGVPARTRQLERGMDPTERVPPDGRVRVGQARDGLRVADAKRTLYRGARRAAPGKKKGRPARETPHGWVAPAPDVLQRFTARWSPGSEACWWGSAGRRYTRRWQAHGPCRRAYPTWPDAHPPAWCR